MRIEFNELDVYFVPATLVWLALAVVCAVSDSLFASLQIGYCPGFGLLQVVGTAFFTFCAAVTVYYTVYHGK